MSGVSQAELSGSEGLGRSGLQGASALREVRFSGFFQPSPRHAHLFFAYLAYTPEGSSGANSSSSHTERSATWARTDGPTPPVAFCP